VSPVPGDDVEDRLVVGVVAYAADGGHRGVASALAASAGPGRGLTTAAGPRSIPACGDAVADGASRQTAVARLVDQADGERAVLVGDVDAGVVVGAVRLDP
jgi:hypothetical protein